ncbi:NlpC/P60 family protein [Coralliovum pocilloporae]|uniref:NlpC/P60 family protein n=1 Tax=Coralliovum pocilloporae TaxID=3066369 RepID=UPI003D9C6327
MMPTTPEDLIAEARSWIGTPYRHQASLKGVGCDCLGLVRGLWRFLYGTEPESLPAYTPDWAEANGEETLAEAGHRHLLPISTDVAEAGDLILFRWQPHCPAKHVGLLSRTDHFIHAQSGAVVSEVPLTGWWRRRISHAFRFPHLRKV